MTKLHAGGKFDNSSYKVSGGLHGVGVSAVNAVSEWLKMTIQRDGKLYEQTYARGEPQGSLEEVGESSSTGTVISFKPDMDIFTTVTEFDYDILNTRLRETAFLNAGLKIVIIDQRGDSPEVVEHQ
jgi:DNA gyrase subunit B